MAGLQQTGSTTSSVTVQCYGLDSSHTRTRYFWWQIYRGATLVDEHGTQMAPGGTTHSTSFYGLDDDTTYSISCGIYDDSNYSTLLASLSGSASTDPETYQCEVYRNYNGSYYLYDSFTTTPGDTYNVTNNAPPTPSGYRFDHVEYYDDNTSPYTVTGSTITFPSCDCGLDYYYVASAGNAYIYNGSTWVQATAYIYNGSAWVQATPNVYSGGWQS